MKIKEIVIEGKAAPEFAVIYIIKKDGDIIYIGKSFRVENRIFDHFVNRGMVGSFSDFGEYARDNMPLSLDWEVDFIEHPKEIKYPERWAREKEIELINIHSPKFNK